MFYKKYIAIFVALLIIVIVSAQEAIQVFSEHDFMLSIPFSVYNLEYHSQPQYNNLAHIMPLVAAKLEVPYMGGEEEKPKEDWFGICFTPDYKKGKANEFYPYEFYVNNKLIKRISLTEMFGQRKDRGVEMVENREVGEDIGKVVFCSYHLTAEGYDLVFHRNASVVKDDRLPGKAKIVIEYDIDNNLNVPIKDFVFLERHRNDDYAVVATKRTLYTINQQAPYIDWPILVEVYSPIPDKLIIIEPKGKEVKEGEKNRTSEFTISEAKFFPVEVPPGGSVSLARLVISATDIASSEEALKQADNLANYLEGNKGKPLMSLRMSADTDKLAPGQTITYTVTFTNIGTAEAKDVFVVDPMPEYARYIPGTAKGEGMEVEYSLDGGKTFSSQEPKEGIVTDIKWKVKKQVNPGEAMEGVFKVLVH